MNISLWANNKKVNKNLIISFAEKSDLLIMFNHAYLLNKYNCLQKHPHKYLMLRSNQTYSIKHNIIVRESYFGIDNIDKYNWDKVFFVDGTEEWYENNSKGKGVHVKSNFFMEIHGIKMKTDPSTGFVGLLAAKFLFPSSNITLVGYTGPKNFYWHDMEFEQTYYRKKNIKIVGGRILL